MRPWPLLPRPRKHYQWYYSTRPANDDMWHCRQGVHAFLRAYYHHKSADWPRTSRSVCKAGRAEELAKMPTYYIMDLGETMAETVAREMPSAAEIAACRWLPDNELAVYAGEYERNGFAGGCSGIAAAQPGLTRRNCNCSPAGRSTCRRCSSPAAAIGAPISGLKRDRLLFGQYLQYRFVRTPVKSLPGEPQLGSTASTRSPGSTACSRRVTP